MASGKPKNHHYESLKRSVKKTGAKDYASVSSSKTGGKPKQDAESSTGNNFPPKIAASEIAGVESESIAAPPSPVLETSVEDESSSHSVRQKADREKKHSLRREKLLASDDWIIRSGHSFTFAGIFLFTIFVFYRPYELIPGLGFLQSGALVIALATLLIYIPTQLSAESSLTMLSTEVKSILALVGVAIITMPIARNPATAWATFNDPFIKAVLMFIVMVNVVRTRKRLMMLVWLSLIISIYISLMAISLYLKGEFKTEGYRVSIDLVGLFNNPNDLAIQLVTMIPIVVGMALASKNLFVRLFFLAVGGLFLFGMLITFSRGAFLAFVAMAAVLVWKLGRAERIKYSIIAVVCGAIFLVIAPGNYGLRVLSIIFPDLDPVGSAGARRDGLMVSILVSIRNPWGIGIGNSPGFSPHGLQTHNSYTQISSELGVLGLTAYVIFIVSALRKLGAIEHTQYAAGERDWYYFMAIAFQGSLVAFMVASFFGSVAYLWYVYYLVAYAVAFRRIYVIEKGLKKEVEAESWREKISALRTV